MHCIQTVKAENSHELQKKLKDKLGIDYKSPKVTETITKGGVEYELTPKVTRSQKTADHITMASA